MVNSSYILLSSIKIILPNYPIPLISLTHPLSFSSLNSTLSFIYPHIPPPINSLLMFNPLLHGYSKSKNLSNPPLNICPTYISILSHFLLLNTLNITKNIVNPHSHLNIYTSTSCNVSNMEC